MSEADKIIKSLRDSGKKVEEFYMSNKTSDKNVANIEDDIEILESIVKVHNDFLQGVNKESINEKEIRALERVLLHYKNMKFNYENLIHDISLIAESLDMQEDSTIEEIALRISEEMYNQQQINEEHQKLNGELRQAINTVEKEKSDWIKAYQEEKDSQFELLKRIKELEEETTKLKAQHIFTRNKATDEEKAELYDVIDKTLGTFLEQEKPIWQQEMTTDKMNLEEALNIVNEMYQDRYKIIQENDTIYVDKLKDVKFTNLEFASVILLREVQSLQNKFKNSIPTQKVIDKTEYLKKQRRELGFKTYLKREDMLNDDRIIVCEIQVLQELLETK